MTLKRMRAAMLAGATITSLTAVGVSVGSSGASGAMSVNWAKVTHLTASGPDSMANLVKAAKTEGTLDVVALPSNWVNYGSIFKAFTKKYGIKISDSNVDGSSGEEVEAVQADKGRTTAPDVIDVGTSYAVQAQHSHLLAPYKVQEWKTIPGALKNASGYWLDDYGGYIAIGCDTSAVPKCPTSFSQMLTETGAEGYKIGLPGSPTQASTSLAAVEAASVANGGSLNNVAPGVNFFATLNKNGAFVPVTASTATVESGAMNIVLEWDYIQASEFSPAIKGWKIILPSDAILGGYGSQAISATAPHPAAARLWEEFLYSTEGQNFWLEGLARPVELPQMTADHTANPSFLSKLPTVPAKAKLLYPSTTQTAAAGTVVDSTWAEQLG